MAEFETTIRPPYVRHIPNLEDIPAEIRELPIWCAWKLVSKPGNKPDKVPVSPITGNSGGWTGAVFCTTAQRAIDYAESHLYLNGIGLVLNPRYGISGGDLDNCRDVSTGRATAEAIEIIRSANTYTEVSPGQGGFRFLFRGSFGGYVGNNRAKGVEFYEDGRFLTFSGDHIEETPFAIEERDLTTLGKVYFEQKAQKRGPITMPGDWQAVELDSLPLSDYSKRLIVEGKPAGERSEHVYGAIKDLIRAGSSDDEICSVLTDPINGLAAAALERRGSIPSAMQWIASQIPKARDEVAREAPPMGGASRTYTLLSRDDLLALPPIEWRIKGLMVKEGAGMLYGPSGVGKSFLTLDMACAVAEGRDWHGFKIKESFPVIYVALEGGGGMPARVRAWEKANGRELPEKLRMIMDSFSFDSDEQVEALTEALIQYRPEESPLVIIDTLARASGALDENSTQDMNRMIAAADSIARRLKGFVLLVHHTGKDENRGARGSSTLKGAMDLEIVVSQGKWKASKIKDGEDGFSRAFNLQRVEIGTDEDGDPITSAVVIPPADISGLLESTPKSTPKTKNQRAVYEVLSGGDSPRKMTFPELLEALKDRLDAEPKHIPTRVKEALKGLSNQGLIETDEEYIWVAE